MAATVNVALLGDTGSTAYGNLLLYSGTDANYPVKISAGSTSYFNGGNVAIGGTGADHTLHLKKSTANGLGPVLMLDNTAGSNTDSSAIIFASGGDTYHRAKIVSTVEGASLYHGNLGFYTGRSDQSTLTEKLQITGDGTHDHKGFPTVNSASIQGLQDSGACYDFNGTSGNFLLTSDGSDAFANQTFTVSGWVNLPDATPSDDNTIFSYDHTSHSAPHYGTHMRVGATGKLFFAWNDGSSYQSLETAGQVFTDNTWHHFACTFKSGKQVIYIDGVEITSSTRTDTITFYAQEVWIGRAGYGTNLARWSGKMRSIQYFPSYLEPADVRKLYSGENPKKNLTQGNLVTNGDFEANAPSGNAPDSWDLGAGGSNSSQSSTKHSGNYGWQLAVDSSNSNVGIHTDAYIMKSGKTYVVEFWAKASAAVDVFNVHAYGASTSSTFYTPAFTTSWVKYSAIYTATADQKVVVRAEYWSKLC